MMRLNCVSPVKRFIALALCATTLLLHGCASDDELARYRIHGNVTYEGKAVPQGTIRFIPDSNAGNRGPASVTQIENGRYDLPAVRGVIGGDYVVSIKGFDGAGREIPGESVSTSGKPLFPEIQLRVELGRDGKVHDFALPRYSLQGSARR